MVAICLNVLPLSFNVANVVSSPLTVSLGLGEVNPAHFLTLYGSVAPLFDGSNDFIDIDTTAIGADIDFDLYTVMAWGKVSAVGVWTDGTLRQLTKIRTNTGADHQFSMSKAAGDNSIRFQRQVNGQTLTHTVGSFSSTDWFCMVMVCTGTGGGNTVRYFLNGVLESTDSSPDAMVGTISQAWIGSNNGGAANVFDGHLGPYGLWNTNLSDEEAAYISRR